MGEKDQQPQQNQPPPQQPKEGDKQPEHHEHHHGKDFAKRLGNAVTFGAGATIGADAVNGVIKNL